MASAVCRLQNKNCFYPIQLVAVRLYSNDVTEIEKKFPKISSDIYTLKRGTGGRSSFNGKIATVFGASGFLGRSVINHLGKIGTQVIIPYRSDPYVVNRLKLCGDLGQILFTPFNLKDEESLYTAMKHSHVVINLIGRNYETENFSLEDVHVTGARTIARIAKELGVETFLHCSALNATENPKPTFRKKGSKFYSTKWQGEQVVREEFPEAIIFRPSDMWGQQDNFLYYYMNFFRRTWRFMSLWKRGKGIIKQPVYGPDVGKGIVKAVMDPNAAGHTFQAIGPHRYEMSELMDWFHRVMNRTEERLYYRLDLRYDFTFWMRLLFYETVPFRYRTLSYERLERENTTDVVDPNLPTLEDLDVELTPIETRVFYELRPFRMHAYHDPLLFDYVRPIEPCPLAKE